MLAMYLPLVTAWPLLSLAAIDGVDDLKRRAVGVGGARRIASGVFLASTWLLIVLRQRICGITGFSVGEVASKRFRREYFDVG